jgi:hypothetical protein
LKSIEASVRLRGGRLDMTVRKARRRERPGYRIGQKFLAYRKNGIEVPFPSDFKTIRIEAILPS